MYKTTKCVGLAVLAAAIWLVGDRAATTAAPDYPSMDSASVFVPLTENADRNGYKIRINGKEFFFRAYSVYDPVTKKLLGRPGTLRYQCESDRAFREMDLAFSVGNSQEKVIPCEIITPRMVRIELQ